MWGNKGIRHSETPVLRTYAEALAHYEAAVPIRGQGKNRGKRPLGSRKHATMQYMDKDEGTGKISCFCWRTPVLTFHTDDTIEIKIDGWVSPTTADFINAVLNTSVSVQGKELRMTHYHGNMREPQTHTIQDGMKIRYTTDQYGQTDIIVQGSKPCYRHKLNRQRWKEVKQMFAPFREYMALVSATQPEFIEVGQRNAKRYLSATRSDKSFRHSLHDTHAFFMDVAKAQKDDNYEAMLPLIKEMAEFCCPGDWRRVNPHEMRPEYWEYEIRTILVKEKLIQNFEGLLKYEFASELFINEVLPDGKYVRDSNAVYVECATNPEAVEQLKAVI
jgi:hypothetical protein